MAVGPLELLEDIVRMILVRHLLVAKFKLANDLVIEDEMKNNVI